MNKIMMNEKALAAIIVCLGVFLLLTSTLQAAVYTSQSKLHRLTPCKDDKYYEVKTMDMKAGVLHVIDLSSKDFDTWLIILDSSGKQIRYNDDASPQTLNSRITFTAPKTDVYQIVITTFQKRATGNYQLKIQTPPQAGK